jgi:hypothetical protein
MAIQEDIRSILQKEGGRPALISNGTRLNMPSPPPGYVQHPLAAQMLPGIDDVPEYDGDLSPIIIHISSPLTVIGNGNLVAIDTDKAAINIANTIARSLKAASVSSTGIPMIDEEGRPRPIEVRVDVGVKIDGTKNTIGEQAVLSALQASFNALKRKRDEAGKDANGNTGMDKGNSNGIDGNADKEKASADANASMDQSKTEGTMEDAKRQRAT